MSQNQIQFGIPPPGNQFYNDFYSQVCFFTRTRVREQQNRNNYFLISFFIEQLTFKEQIRRKDVLHPEKE